MSNFLGRDSALYFHNRRCLAVKWWFSRLSLAARGMETAEMAGKMLDDMARVYISSIRSNIND